METISDLEYELDQYRSDRKIYSERIEKERDIDWFIVREYDKLIRKTEKRIAKMRLDIQKI